jgi:hypothetical protein
MQASASYMAAPRGGWGRCAAPLLKAQPRCRGDRLLLHRGGGIANGDALLQILLKELLKATEPLILQCVDELVKNQWALAPAIGPDVDTVSQGQSAGARADKLRRFSSGAKSRMLWDGNMANTQQSDFVRVCNTNLHGVRGLGRCEWHAITKDATLLDLCPCTGQRKEHLELVGGYHIGAAIGA